MERLSLNKKDEQLDEYIKEGKLKPALKLIETKEKKGDKSTSLAVKKIITLFSFQDEGHKQLAAKEISKLVLRNSQITDHQALKTLDTYLSGNKERDEFCNNLWVVAGGSSKDETFLWTWFQVKFDQERWEAAQKVFIHRSLIIPHHD